MKVNTEAGAILTLLIGPPVIILVAWMVRRQRIIALALIWAVWVFCSLWLIEQSVDYSWRIVLWEQSQPMVVRRTSARSSGDASGKSLGNQNFNSRAASSD